MHVNTDYHWMQYAYELALKAQAQGEVPVGAVIVGADGILLGSGYNQSIAHQDPSAHAEITAIRHACSQARNYRLPEATLFVTLEPCAMCAGAMIQARLARVVFATRDFKTGCAGSVYNLLNGAHFNHRIQIDEGLMQQACADLLHTFFAGKP